MYSPFPVITMRSNFRFLHHTKRFWRTLGPGLITGASDDDPSAITTFSQAGAAYGLTTLWMALAAYPILAIIQEMCARIGIVSGKGLTSLVKNHYPSWLLYILILLTCPAFLLNIGADIAILGEAGNLIFPHVPPIYCSIGFTVLLFILILFLPYKKLVSVMKFVCLVLLVYLVVPFFNRQNMALIFKSTLIPSIRFDKDFVLIITGLTGAIISPYLFFWQASSEVEEMDPATQGKKVIKRYTFLLMRKDILSGAFFAVLIMYFIILTTGTILHDHGVRNINSIRDAAVALKPLAGKLSYLLFSIGIIGTGFLIIPVLSATISYIIMEALDFKAGLSKKPGEAKLFYFIIGISMCCGIAMHWLHINSVKALLLTTVLYGITAPLLIGIILLVANNHKIMGQYRNNRISNISGILILLFMLANLAVLGYFMFK
jgi:NRAMP (natural resistance-associated macrophage protein)-like metal ion transporter